MFELRNLEASRLMQSIHSLLYADSSYTIIPRSRGPSKDSRAQVGSYADTSPLHLSHWFIFKEANYSVTPFAGWPKPTFWRAWLTVEQPWLLYAVDVYTTPSTPVGIFRTPQISIKYTSTDVIGLLVAGLAIFLWVLFFLGPRTLLKHGKSRLVLVMTKEWWEGWM